jgi:hypothetical protein
MRHDAVMAKRRPAGSKPAHEDTPMTAEPRRLLLMTAFRNVINEPNIEAGFEKFAALTGDDIDFGAFSEAVAACLRDGLIREPIRLPEGALQCHWHLELTPKGVAAARQALDQ